MVPCRYVAIAVGALEVLAVFLHPLAVARSGRVVQDGPAFADLFAAKPRLITVHIAFAIASALKVCRNRVDTTNGHTHPCVAARLVFVRLVGAGIGSASGRFALIVIVLRHTRCGPQVDGPIAGR